MDAKTRLAIESLLDTRISNIRSVHGGDINAAHRVTLESGHDIFAKTNPGAPTDMFEREAQGLEWLRVGHGLSVAKVIGHSTQAGAPFLLLEWIQSKPRNKTFSESLGQGLAYLHNNHAPHFGLDHTNYIGTLTQTNRPRATWSKFYGEERLLPQIEAASQNAKLSHACTRALEGILARLDDILAPQEKPSRLHGDLWSGNVHVNEQGDPVLIDPAVYGGHREMDLAMMKLFGGFDARTFEAYHATCPLEPDWENRIELHQLYPLLVHVNLFGGHYAHSVEHIAKKYI